MFTRDYTTFFNSYQRTAVWSSLDDEGKPLDKHSAELSEETKNSMAEDCKKFLYMHKILSPIFEQMDIDDIGAAGYMFWLTRNRHGSGFWDDEWIIDGVDYSQALTDWAHAFGECDLYLGDDGLIYHFPE